MRLLNNLIEAINELDEVKKYKRLEKIIDQSDDNNVKLKKIFSLQKQIINSKHYDLHNNYSNLLNEYNFLKKELEEDVLVSLFLDSLDEVNDILEIITSTITNIINEKIEI